MGVDKKTTLMVIKVDLQCCRCYKKIKKVLCGIPQIQDQVYNEKENFVIIKVVCCSPEKIKQKIICKGGCAVKSIEIKEVDKPKGKPEESEKRKKKPPEKRKEEREGKPPEKPKEKPPEKPKEKLPEEEKKPEPPKDKPKVVKPEEIEMPEEPTKPKRFLKAEEPGLQLAYPVPFGTCCTACYEGRGGGPCYSGHGRPPPCYDGYYGRPIYDSYGGGGGYGSSYASRCDYFSEENSSGCSIM